MIPSQIGVVSDIHSFCGSANSNLVELHNTIRFLPNITKIRLLPIRQILEVILVCPGITLYGAKLFVTAFILIPDVKPEITSRQRYYLLKEKAIQHSHQAEL